MSFAAATFSTSALCFSCFFFSSRRRHTRSLRDWSSDVCSSDLAGGVLRERARDGGAGAAGPAGAAGARAGDLGPALRPARSAAGPPGRDGDRGQPGLGAHAGWTSVRTLVGGAIGLVLLAAFVVVELRSRSPLMPLRLLRIRTVRGGVLVTAAFMSSFGLQLFFLTLYLQQGLGQAPLKAGLSFLPLVLSVVAGTQVGGRLVGRVGISRTLAAGMTFGAVGLALYLRLPATPSLAILLPGMIVAGLGQGVAFTTMYVAAGTGVARGEQGVASAMASTAQQIGGSVGLAVLVALLSARAVALGGSPGGPTAQPPAILTGALHVTFAAQAAIALLGAAVALFVIGPGERTRRRRRQPEPECCPEEPVRRAA